MARTKGVIVSGGKGRHAPKYELAGEIFQSTYKYPSDYSTRAEWRKLIDDAYSRGRTEVTFRSYNGVACSDRVVAFHEDGSLNIGCNRFSRTSLRKIAKWAGWPSFRIRKNLPVIKKQKQA